jgi:hypothetical protein
VASDHSKMNALIAVCFAALVALAAAGDGYGAGYGQYNRGHGHNDAHYRPSSSYGHHGHQDRHAIRQYPGYCHHDGLYVHDHVSFYQCDAGIAHHQPCAPGTTHDVHKFHSNNYYEQAAFCDTIVPVPAAPQHNDYYQPYQPQQNYAKY